MSPLYNSQVVAGGQLPSAWPGSPVDILLFNGETPTAGQASIAFAITPKTASGGQQTLSFQFECPGGIGSGVFQIQDSDGPPSATGAEFNSINFGGATPGVVNSSTVNASGTARVELQTAARFARVLCITAPGAAITVRGRQH